MSKRIDTMPTIAALGGGAMPCNSRAVGAIARRSSGEYLSVCALNRALDVDPGVGVESDLRSRLRPMELRLLSLLERSPNRAIRTEAIVATLYGNVTVRAGRVRLRRLVADMRLHLDADLAKRVQTIPGIGLLLMGVPE